MWAKWDPPQSPEAVSFGFNSDFSGGFSKVQAQDCQQKSYLCKQTLERTIGRFMFGVVAEVESRLLRLLYDEKYLWVGEKQSAAENDLLGWGSSAER